MKNKSFIKYIYVFFILIFIFIACLILSSIFSSENIYDNVKESSEVLLDEGNRKIIYIPYRGEKMQFDNYTDALMINTAYSIDHSTPLYSAFVARKNYIPNITTEVYEDSVGELKSSSKYKYHNEVGELNDLINGEKTESFEYARYWHGYLSVLRPLLLLFNITQLRNILTILLIVLALILAFLLYKKINIIVSIIYLLSLFSVEYFYLGFSMQGIFVFLIAIIATIILIKMFNRIKNFGLMFFVTGMITNYLDFLTVPLITLALPLTTYFLLKQRKDDTITLETQFIDFVKLCVLWGIGYGVTWFTKWLLVDIIYNKAMILTAIKQVLYRSAGIKQCTTFEVMLENFAYISKTLIIVLLFTIITINFKIILSKKHYQKDNSVNGKKIFTKISPYLIIAIMPFIWYAVLKNHSYYHAFFTYRNLILTVLGINLCIEETYRTYLNIKEKTLENYKEK